MKLIYFLLFICWASARPLTRSKVKSAVDFQDITLDRIAEIDYADNPTSYRKLTLAEMARDFAAFDSEEDDYEGPTVMTARMAKKRKGGHGRHSHEDGHKKPGHHHHHSHEHKHSNHGHGHHHGHHHHGKHSHETGTDETTTLTSSTTTESTTITTPTTPTTTPTTPTTTPTTTPSTTTTITTTTKRNNNSREQGEKSTA